MARHSGPVLVDTNVIIECHRTRTWAALAGGYAVETVEKCFEETQTGFQRRRPEQQIDPVKLSNSLKKRIHEVGDALRASAMLREPLFGSLDAGEQHLWAHALGRKDGWILCGPDKASLRFGIRCGFRERLVSLEKLLKDAGLKPKDLKTAYTTKWLEQTLSALSMEERKKS
jgi:hypothetical protein